LNGFRIKLLNAEKNMISLPGEEDGKQATPVSQGAKKAASDAPDAPAGHAHKRKRKATEA